jgi:hypothetical protein
MQREENILLSLKKLHYLSRSQLQKLHKLGSDRNAQRVLKNMSDYISSFKDHEYIYYLNKEGRERVNSKKTLKKTIQARHFIMRNDLYLDYDSPTSWKNEVKLGIKEDKSTLVVCDAVFQIGKQYHVVEVDHTQKMIKNKSKMERYKKLIKYRYFEITPKFIWITTTEYRRKQLLEICKGLNVKVYTTKDFY